MKDGLDDLGSDLNIEIMSPTEAGRLTGSKPEERSRQAGALAAATKGDMVIYGRLDSTGTMLQPEFYVSPDFLADAEELVGVFQLGTPITSGARPGTPAVAIGLRENLQRRTSALTAFVVGLVRFANKEFTRADAEFKRAIDDAGWPEADGKEVVHLFSGTSAGLQGRLADARASYQRALDLNPDYGRAMIGLAEVRLREVGRSCDSATVDAAGLREARDLYRAADKLLDQPTLSNVPAKAHFGVARVDICLSQAMVEGAWLEAAKELGAVISEFESGNETIQDLAAEAHGQLATVQASGRRSCGSEGPTTSRLPTNIVRRSVCPGTGIDRPSSATTSAGCSSGSATATRRLGRTTRRSSSRERRGPPAVPAAS